MRTPEERKYHATKERQYRQRKKNERDLALVRLAEAVSTLRRHGLTVGQLTDLIIEMEK